MKKILIPTALLCTVLCIGLYSQPDKAEKATTTPEPPKVEVTVTPTEQTPIEIAAIEQESVEPTIEVITLEPTSTPEPMSTQMPAPAPITTQTPAPTPTPTTTSEPVISQPAQSENEFYFPGFGYIESLGEGTVTHDETIYENGNKVGSMD